MKVVLVLGPSTGGIGRHVQTLGTFLGTAGHELSTVGPGETLDRFPMAGNVVRGLSVGAARRVALRGDGPATVVHAHGVRAGLVAAAALLGRRIPLVVTWHNMINSGTSRGVGTGGRLGSLAQRFVARRAAVSLCVSPDLVEHVRRLGGRPRLAPVGAARRPPSDRTPAQTRTELGLDADARLVLAVARLHPQKGLDVLQEAARSLPADVVVVVAGEGPQRDQLGPPLHLLGARDDVADLLAAADVVVLPSRWEGSPLAAHEALLAARPLVTTSAGGIPALVGDADPPPAVLVPAENASALATALRDLLDDPGERAALAERARVRAEQWPDARRTVENVLAVYRELTQGVAR